MTNNLVEIIVEKGLLALIIALTGYWISKYLEINKQRITLENKIIETNDIIEREYILKNHNEILSIIENNIHLIEMDNKLQDSINAYIKHVAVYDTIRKITSTNKLNPIDFDAPYPNSFIVMIKERMTVLQNKNNELLNET